LPVSAVAVDCFTFLLDFADFFVDLVRLPDVPAFDVDDFAGDFVDDLVDDCSVDCVVAFSDDCATSTDVLTSDVANSAPIAVTMAARPRANRAAERFRADTDMRRDLKGDAGPWGPRQS
jgi:hypothetical protein